MMQQSAPSADPLLKVDNLVVEYFVGGKTVHAVSGVSLEIARGETLGLVGESGCGKSTLGRAVLQLRPAVSGKVLFDGHELTAMQGDRLRKMRQRVQLIFQDPIASLNPRRRIGDIVAEPLVIAGMKDPEKRNQLGSSLLSSSDGTKPCTGVLVCATASDVAHSANKATAFTQLSPVPPVPRS